MGKTIAEINERIKRGEAVVVTAEEVIDLVKEEGASETARKVDVITTGTFGPMCSSGAFINVGHAQPRMKISRAWLNDVPVFCGIAAVDIYIGATEMAEHDPLNEVFPGEFRYGGGHVIEDLVAGKTLHLRAESYGTDCYPNRHWEKDLTLSDVKEAWLFNPRNAYQNYNVAVNLSDRVIYTYMGVLRPDLGNANYSSAGQLSPLLNDPLLRTIGIGTRIFLGGGDRLRGLVRHPAPHRRASRRGRGTDPSRRYPVGNRRSQGDGSALPHRLLHAGIRRQPGGGDRRSHPCPRRGRGQGSGGARRGPGGAGGGLFRRLPAGYGQGAGRGHLRGAQERQHQARRQEMFPPPRFPATAARERSPRP